MRLKSFADMKCSIAQALEVVGDRWTVLILRDALRGTTRFGGFLENLGIARNVLAQRLDGLVENGVLERVPYQDKPTRHEYRLTPKGLDTFPVVAALLAWGDRWVPPDGPPVVLVHKTCGEEAAPVLVCGHCHHPISALDIGPRPSPGA